MIGGTDIVFPAIGDATTLEACARIVRRYWPEVRYEDAITGEKFGSLGDVAFGQVTDLLAYPDAASERLWDTESLDSQENSMISIIVRPDEITIVVDDPAAEGMEKILNSIRSFLRVNGFLAGPRVAA